MFRFFSKKKKRVLPDDTIRVTVEYGHYTSVGEIVCGYLGRDARAEIDWIIKEVIRGIISQRNNHPEGFII